MLQQNVCQRLTLHAAENIHKFGDLAPLFTLVAGSDGVRDAMRNMIGKDFLLGTAQSGTRRRELRDDVDTVAIVLDHARQPAHLALDPLQPLEHRCLGIRAHSGYIPLPGIRYKGRGPWTIAVIRTMMPPTPSIRCAG